MKFPLLSGPWVARLQPAAVRLRAPLALAPAAVVILGADVVRLPAPFAAPPMPLARWLALRSHSTAAGASLVAPLVPAPTPAVLVKVGEAGLYSLIKVPKVMGMDRMSLLEALASHKGFAATLSGVALHECVVRVCASASTKAPSTAEAAAASELEGTETLCTLASSVAPTPLGSNLFVRVTLPAGETAPPVVTAQGEFVRARCCLPALPRSL